jgi:hypothetical protein
MKAAQEEVIEIGTLLVRQHAIPARSPDERLLIHFSGDRPF